MDETAGRAAAVREGPACPVCGGTSYRPGPLGRLGPGRMPPQCARCGALERHRVLRALYDAMPDALLARRRCLQFSDDGAAPRRRFASFEVSIYGKENSLDLTAVARPNASCDWVIANHVLSAVADDRRAITEIFRIMGGRGVVQLCDADPASRIDTWEWGFPDRARHDLHRLYGSDLGLRVAGVVADAAGIGVAARDAVTGGREMAFFFSRDYGAVRAVSRALIDAGCVVWRAA